MSWFDTHAAAAAARSWLAGGDRLETEARTIALQVDALRLQGAPSGIRELDLAGDELHTLARFTIAVRDRVRRSDRLPDTDTDVADLWSDMAALVDQTAARRHDDAADRATARFLTTLDPDQVRERFEAQHGRDPVQVLSQLTDAEIAAYWEALPEPVRIDVAGRRPDLVALRLLASGVAVSPDVAEALDRANAFGRFEESFAVGLGVSISTRVITIDLGAGLAVIVSKRSDGSVELTLVGSASAGVGVDLDVPRTASAAGVAARFGALQRRFRFGDEATAARAIETLREAARHDLSPGELLRDGAGAVWNGPAGDWNAAAGALNRLLPFGDPIPRLPTHDLTPETVRRLREFWASHGVTRTRSTGLDIGVSAEFETAIDAIDAALSGEAAGRLMRYDVEAAETGAAETAGARDRTGVVFSGTASIDIAGGLPGQLPGQLPGGHGAAHAAAAAGFVVDLHHVDEQGTFLTVTLHTDLRGGTAAQVIDLGVAGLDETIDDTAAVTIEVSVPVDVATADAVGDLGAALAGGRWSSDIVARLLDRAEIDAIVTTGTVSTRAADADVGVVGIEAGVDRATTATVAALHRYPGGETFSRIEVDRLIDAARLASRRRRRPRP